MISIRGEAPVKKVGKDFLEAAALEPFPPRQGEFRDGANRSGWPKATGDFKVWGHWAAQGGSSGSM